MFGRRVKQIGWIALAGGQVHQAAYCLPDSGPGLQTQAMILGGDSPIGRAVRRDGEEGGPLEAADHDHALPTLGYSVIGRIQHSVGYGISAIAEEIECLVKNPPALTVH